MMDRIGDFNRRRLMKELLLDEYPEAKDDPE
jgi:hypothetical protein